MYDRSHERERQLPRQLSTCQASSMPSPLRHAPASDHLRERPLWDVDDADSLSYRVLFAYARACLNLVGYR